MTRRTCLALTSSAYAACPAPGYPPLDGVPDSAAAIARDLNLTDWPAYRAQQQRDLARRIAEGSAEHLTYYVLQSRRFTDRPPLDPVRLAATKPSSMPPPVAARFADFAAVTQPLDPRHALIQQLHRELQWTPEACFVHTMHFLAERSASQRAERDALYQRRGLSSDTTAEQTQVIDRALAFLKAPPGRTLLVGPGLDLTRREGFTDDLPLRIHQVERLLLHTRQLDCADVRPEVLSFLATRPVCPLQLDITTTVPPGPYQLIVATNLFVYLDDRSLFAAFAAIAQALAPGGALVHNDSRFAAKVFGQVLKIPVAHFEAFSLGQRQGVDQIDRVVIHRR